MITRRHVAVVILGALAIVGCSGSSPLPMPDASGGSSLVAGASSTGGLGTTSGGGSDAGGGSTVVGGGGSLGGATSIGGTPATGGVAVAGGATNTGGQVNTGGRNSGGSANGGAATGGKAAGGTTTGSGGANVGGNVTGGRASGGKATGGAATGSGGTNVGGTTATGSTATGGRATGGSATGSGGTSAGGAQTGDKYYVGGPSASDSNPGTSAQPFATISKCASVALAGDTCHINTGVYRETVVPASSGTAAAPITYAAVSGAQVTIDGTDAVSGWMVDSGSVYKATVKLSGTAAKQYSSTPYPPNDELWANQIFAGTTMVPEAAFPAPSTNIWAQSYSSFSSTRSTSNTCSTPPCTAMATGTLNVSGAPAAGDMTGAVAYFAGGWVALSADITGGTLNGTMNISFPVSDAKVFPGGGNNNKVRIVGSRALLTAANQWYYNPGTTTLYLWAQGGGAPSNVFAKKRNYAFDLRGKSYITVTGIGLFAATVTTDDTSNNITLDGLRGQYLSHWQTGQYDSTLPFAGIYDANHRFDSGVLLHGTNNVLKNSVLHLSAGNGANIRGSGSTLQNCTIYDVSYGGTYTAAVTIEVGSHDLKILNNTLYNTGRDVINMNTNAYPNAGYKNNEIAYNNIYGYARTQFDLGGIYSCCDTSHLGSRWHHNWIHDPANTGNGMHLDNGTYDVAVDHNVIWGLKGTGDVSHGGNGINLGGHTNARPAGSNLPYLKVTFYNNTIVSGQNYTIFNYFASASHDANMTVRNNILDGARPTGQNFGYIAGGTPVEDHNLVTANGSAEYTNAAAGDFTLKSTSSAINAGVVITGITDGAVGAPDQGAYESGQTKWVPGSTVAP